MERTRVFDIDHTLYPFSQGVEAWFAETIDEIISRELEVDRSIAGHLREDYYRLFGSTLTGLMYFHELPLEKFFHDAGHVPLSVIERTPGIDAALEKLAAPAIGFTNATGAHGRRVIQHLGVDQCFSAIYGIDDLGYWGKPFPKAFERFFALSGIVPEETIFFEDSARNLAYPKLKGMTTVLVGEEIYPKGSAPEYVDYHASNITEALEMTNGL